MTLKELNQLYYLSVEIAHLKKEIEKRENQSDIRAQVITGMPFGGKLSDPTGERGTELSDNKMLLNLALIKAEIEKNKIERYISQIDNSEMRTIIRLRCIEFRTWEQIGAELHMHRTTAKRKISNYIKNAHNAH
ncbi:MAG: hypothetical protein UE866_00720 [Clostridia bacterium]|jgi:hypothetical protein|nr:hypothetical protein [Clostridia bacterium]DAZ36524.1 MAG TPA: Protein of unknown function (DUF1492) [Caudoviricetes sp.]